MRDRGKLTRSLLVAAALGAVAFAISRRLTRRSANPALPSDVRAAVDEGIAAANGHTPATEPEWIPVGAPEVEPEVVESEATPDAGVAATA
jgi:hypothetical protein